MTTATCTSLNKRFKAGVNLNSSEVLGSLKEGFKGRNKFWNATRQLIAPERAPQVVGNFLVYINQF